MYASKQYANMVYNSYAGGIESELTAITQYIYEHIEYKNMNDLSMILREIAIEEMMHLNIIGEILVNLGEKPIYKSSKQKLWTANEVDYKYCDIKEAMKINILGEEAVIRTYRILERYTSNPYLKKVYQRIILDEMTHKKIFEKIKESV